MTRIICFDLRCLQIGHESRGIGMHARSILENIDPNEDVRYVIYAFDKNDPIKNLGIRMPVPYTLVQTKWMKKSIDRPQDFFNLAQIIWHKYRPLKNKDVDVFIQFDFMLGLPRFTSVKKVLIAYDLIPLKFKRDYIPTPFMEFKKHHGIFKKTKKALRATYYQMRYWLHYKNFQKADMILGISDDTAKSLHDILSIPYEKITTIPLAPVFNTDKAKKPSALSISTPFIFYIGATDPRKRVQDLIEAFSIARSKGVDIDLILAGKEFAKPEKIPQASIVKALRNNEYRSNIHSIGYVDDSEKLWLYKNAVAFVFPTAYEGFGLPVLEAMKMGCPVISYDNSSIPEVVGDAAILIETGDVSSLATGILRINSDSSLRSTLIDRGVERAKEFTWSGYMNNFYEKVL